MSRSPASGDSPGVLVWPPALYAGAFALGLALDWLVPLGHLPALPSRLLGTICLVVGAGVAHSGEKVMRRAGTNVRPDLPTTVLVTEGPFGRTRNPLYLGLTLMYAGLALLIPGTWLLLLLVPVLLVMQRGVIAREERYLERKFGEPYRVYLGRVRRWL